MGKLNYRIPNTNDFREIYVKVTDTLPIGAVCQYGGSTAPSGYLMCNGQAVSRTTYADLFKAIGTSFGAGDGITTFNVPNFNGKVPVGLDGTDTDFDTIGETGGSKYLQEHSHILGKSAGGGSETDWAYTVSNVSNAGNASTQNAGTGDSGNLQPYIVVNFIIKASKKVALDKGNVVDSLDGNDTDSAPSVRAINDALDNYQTKGQVLWTNANPSNEFGAQNIELNLRNYDVIEIYFTRYGGVNEFCQKVSFQGKTKYTQLNYSDFDEGQVRSWNRNVTVGNSGLGFNICTINGVANNLGLIPYAIIGYKTGLFS